MRSNRSKAATPARIWSSASAASTKRASPAPRPRGASRLRSSPSTATARASSSATARPTSRRSARPRPRSEKSSGRGDKLGTMPRSHFHPVIQRWFTDTLGAPTEAQRQGWAAIRERKHTLIAAPTGSGKTLAAFLTALDELFVEGLDAPLPDEVRVVYVSPLKALSADIHKNLAEPRRGIRKLAEAMGIDAPKITAAVRTGDTTQSERAAMLRKPPHILVTTPESLYLLLTAERSRNMLKTARTVIVDEIHAVIGTRRGAHLALTLERLQAVANAPLLRLGLSATQKPIDDVARWLAPQSDVEIIDEGHRRALDLAIEIPRSSVETGMANEGGE